MLRNKLGTWCSLTSSHTHPRLLTPHSVVCMPRRVPPCRHCPLHTTAATLSHATATASYYLHPHVQPIPHPVVCTAPSCATALPPPSTRRRCPLHAGAAALYVPPPLPSTCCCRRPLHATPTAPMCHHWPHHRPLPLRAAPPLSVAFVHMPRAARAPRGAHCRRMHLAHVHTSHTGPHTTPLRPPCLGPVPGPICGRAPRLGPHCIRPCLPGPIRGRCYVPCRS